MWKLTGTIDGIIDAGNLGFRPPLCIKTVYAKTKIGKGIKMLLMKRSFDRVFVEEIRQV